MVHRKAAAKRRPVRLCTKIYLRELAAVRFGSFFPALQLEHRHAKACRIAETNTQKISNQNSLALSSTRSSPLRRALSREKELPSQHSEKCYQ